MGIVFVDIFYFGMLVTSWIFSLSLSSGSPVSGAGTPYGGSTAGSWVGSEVGSEEAIREDVSSDLSPHPVHANPSKMAASGIFCGFDLILVFMYTTVRTN